MLNLQTTLKAFAVSSTVILCAMPGSSQARREPVAVVVFAEGGISAAQQRIARATLEEHIVASQAYRLIDTNEAAFQGILEDYKDLRARNTGVAAMNADIGNRLAAQVVCRLELLREGTEIFASATLSYATGDGRTINTASDIISRADSLTSIQEGIRKVATRLVGTQGAVAAVPSVAQTSVHDAPLAATENRPASSAKALSPGDRHNGDIFVHVDPDGRNGLVCATENIRLPNYSDYNDLVNAVNEKNFELRAQGVEAKYLWRIPTSKEMELILDNFRFKNISGLYGSYGSNLFYTVLSSNPSSIDGIMVGPAHAEPHYERMRKPWQYGIGTRLVRTLRDGEVTLK